MSESKTATKSAEREGAEENLRRLMTLAQAGDAAAYRTLLTELKGIATGLALAFFARTGAAGDAEWEDSVQDILIAVHDKRHTYDREQPFMPWFHALARYKMIDRMRERNRRPRLAHDGEVEALADEPAEWLAGQDVDRLLASLPEKQSQAIRLMKLEGLSVAETGTRLGLSESDVKVSVHRGLKTLKAELERKK